jgi:hypothetical protein
MVYALYNSSKLLGPAGSQHEDLISEEIFITANSLF